jgi:hypothetical protein
MDKQWWWWWGDWRTKRERHHLQVQEYREVDREGFTATVLDTSFINVCF